MEALLEQRIFWLEKFLRNSVSFRHYLQNSISSDDCKLFEENRHRLLKIIRDLDKRILAARQELPLNPEQYPVSLREKIRFYESEKERILKEQGSVDQEILAGLEKLREEDEKKLKALQKGRTALSKYHSQEREAERLDKKL